VTARAALDELEHRRVVRRRRGSGTYVSRRYDLVLAPHPTPSWSQLIRAAGGQAHATLLDTLEGDRRVPAELLAGDDPVTTVDWLGWVDGIPVLCKISWLLRDLVPA
jgi:GntR family transcriptional regulator